MCQTVVARHNCLHCATHIKKCAAIIEKERGTHNKPTIWTRMTSFLSGCRKLWYNDSQGPMVQEREDAKRGNARDIQFGKFVGQKPRSSTPTAPFRVPLATVQPPPRLAARPPHRSRFAEVGLASDTPISAQQDRPGLARQNTVRGGSSSNTAKQAQSTNGSPPYHRRVEWRDVGDLPIPTPVSISWREIRQNCGENKPLPPIPLRSQKQVFGRANPSCKQSIPRKPVASPKSKGGSPPLPPLRLPNFGSSSDISSRSDPRLNQTSWPHSNGDTGRLRTPATVQTPQISRVRESIVNGLSALTAVICDAREGLYIVPMDSYFAPALSQRTAPPPPASHNTWVDPLPRLAPTVYRPPTSPPPSLRPGRRNPVSATPSNMSVDLDSVEGRFSTAASQAQARNQVRDLQRSNTPPRRTSNGRRSPRQSGGCRAGWRN